MITVKNLQKQFKDHKVLLGINETIQEGEVVVDELICENPRCISATEQELHHTFKLVNREMGIYRCIYCESKKVLKQ